MLFRFRLVLWPHSSVRKYAKLGGRECFLSGGLGTRLNAGGVAKKQEKVARLVGSKTAMRPMEGLGLTGSVLSPPAIELD